MDRRLLIIVLVLFTTFTGFGMIIPVLPDAILAAGAKEYHLGLMLSLYSLVSLIVSPLWGSLSDRIGRKPVIFWGMLGFAASFLLLAISGRSLFLMYASRFLGGLFSGAAIASSVAYVADITSEEERTKGMAYVGMAIGLGFVAGPALGGVLGSIFLALPFEVATVLSLLVALLVAYSLTESLPEEKRGRGEKVTWRDRLHLLQGPMAYLFTLSFLVTFTLAAIEATLFYFEAQKVGLTRLELGWLFMIIGIVGALVQGGIVRRVKKGQESTVLIFGFLLSALGFVLIMFSSSFWTAALYLSVFGIGNALQRPAVTSLITQKTPAEQGVTSGTNSAMDSLGRIIGPVVGSGLYSLNIYLPYVAGALLSLLAVVIVFLFRRLEGSRLKNLEPYHRA
ncbi:MAG: MFS transporter [Candidatus Carbobacillus altaicus]|uniref:Multidrug-efflux transporter n=1 Tax=Candidatus Carbonibacillus altaicus TaxID=2163959 RepID=A0A2R6Y0R5_9BACL|nr:MFS transporter [Candidatus Carbobacillus altaicus]PTQ56278.1 MAG: Multidrug-efflux transporter [Candidatus Carbobacillus altaicus]